MHDITFLLLSKKFSDFQAGPHGQASQCSNPNDERRAGAHYLQKLEHFSSSFRSWFQQNSQDAMRALGLAVLLKLYGLFTKNIPSMSTSLLESRAH